MIITRLTGGLGNQMFQYAAGLALAEHRRTVLKLDVSWFGEDPQFETHNRYGLSCFNITEQFATQDEIERVAGVPLTRTERWSVRLARALHFYRYARRTDLRGNLHYAESFAFYPGFFQQPDPTYLHGNWQSAQFFEPVAPLLRQHFSIRYPAAPEISAVAERIRSGPSAAIHLRRGDYGRIPQYARELGILGPDYYQRAVRLLRERSPAARLFIFSDDIEAVARDFTPPGPHEFVPCASPWDSLRLMSLCEHIATANSTFSWWAAWLNPRPDKLVIAPQPWFAHSEHDESTLVPDAWRRLARQ